MLLVPQKLTQNVVAATDGCRNNAMKHIRIRVTANLLVHPFQDRFRSNGGEFFFSESVVQWESPREVAFHKLMKDPLVSIDLACFGCLDRHVFVCGIACRHSVKCLSNEGVM